MDKEQRTKRFAEILLRTRYQGKLTQTEMADIMNVSKRTVENWENGKSIPNFLQCVDWFEASGVNPFSTMIRYFYPDEMTVQGSSSDDEIDAALRKTLALMSHDDKRALLFMIYGDHGSSAKAVLQLVLAHLHTPLKDRIANAVLVAQMYSMEKRLNNLICKNNIMPNDEILYNAIDEATKATIAGKYGYVNDMTKH